MKDAEKKNLQLKEDRLKAREAERRKARDTKLAITHQLIAALPDMPVAYELLCEFFKLDARFFDDIPERLVKEHGVTEFYKTNVGGLPGLMQEIDFDDGGAYYHAWGVGFLIFDRELYFVPYKDRSKGFACSVLGQLDKDLFEGDITREYAVAWVAKYLRDNKK